MRVCKLGPKSSSNSGQPSNPHNFSLPIIFTQAFFSYLSVAIWVLTALSFSYHSYHPKWQILATYLFYFFDRSAPESRSWQLNSFFFARSAPDLGNLTLSFLTGALQIWATSPLCTASSSVPSASWPTSSSAHSLRTTPLSNGPGRELTVMNQLEGPLS
jgi:hypothetical protein